jgi:hypothetical protein
MEAQIQTDTIRKRYRYLSHLPLTTNFWVRMIVLLGDKKQFCHFNVNVIRAIDSIHVFLCLFPNFFEEFVSLWKNHFNTKNQVCSYFKFYALLLSLYLKIIH